MDAVTAIRAARKGGEEVMENYFHVSTKTFYYVSCEGCGISSAPFEDEDEAIEAATTLGFTSKMTENDGILNFCHTCTKEQPK